MAFLGLRRTEYTPAEDHERDIDTSPRDIRHLVVNEGELAQRLRDVERAFKMEAELIGRRSAAARGSGGDR
jgi:hypothetical protein